MYDIKTIKKALKLLKQYDYKFIKVSRKLGIPRATLRSWHRKELENKLSLIIKDQNQVNGLMNIKKKY